MLLALGCVLALGAGAIVYFAANDISVSDGDPVSPAKARAIGARWRLVKSDALALRYAEALAAAGLYDELLKELRDGGLLAADERARLLFASEAMLRQRRYDDANETARRDGDDPWFSFIRARAHYALTPDAKAVFDDLQDALRGPDALAAEAWLFRARLALDVNDFETAAAAGRRAREAGAGERHVNAVAIESLIRTGEEAAAARLLAERNRQKRADDADARLAAMISLRQGDARAAARRLAAAGGKDGPNDLLAALAKWRAGDIAQAYAQAERELILAPQNWMALDLLAAIARDMGKGEEADRLIERLAASRPGLATVRRLRLQTDPDAAYAALATLSGASDISGVGAALLGADADLPEALREATQGERALIALAAALAANEVKAIDPDSVSAGGAVDPIVLTFGGAGYEALGEWAKADEMYVRASVVAPDFFRPVMNAADLARRRGANSRAIKLLSRFAEAHPDHVEARLALARAYEAAADFNAAADAYARIAPEILFASPEAARAYAAAATQAGRTAREAMLIAAAAGATDAKILGETLFIAGDDEGAAAALRKALIADPANQEIARRYVEAMTRLGRGDDAQSLLKAIKNQASAGAAVEESGADKNENARNKVKNQP